MKSTWKQLGLALFISASLAACSSGGKKSDPSKDPRTPGQPVVRVGFKDRGLASWYGNKFHGRKTASGERYDMNQLTAAHRTLPFGTRVKVSDPSSGNSVTVRINDRGPFGKNRLIDLSRSAAKALGIIRKGLAPVEIEVIQLF